MNPLTWTFLVGCAVLLFAAQRTEGVKCYTCLGTTCKDPFDAKQAKIEEKCSSCTKMKVKDLVTRVCSLIKTKEGCQKAGEAFNCGCSTDLCNGSINIAASTMVLGALTAACLLFKKI